MARPVGESQTSLFKKQEAKNMYGLLPFCLKKENQAKQYIYLGTSMYKNAWRALQKHSLLSPKIVPGEWSLDEVGVVLV